MILVNFKVYKESFGDGVIKLAEACEKVSKKTGVKIIPVVSPLDAARIKEKFEMEVYLQSVDLIEKEASTGAISPFQAKELNIEGTVINHSEKRIKPGSIKKLLNNWPEGFKSILCISSLGQVDNWGKSLKPTMIAYEPKELIGSKDKSVATEKPEIIKKMVEKFNGIPVLVGAGIHSKEDVRVSLKLGAKGVLISSYIVKSDNPERELMEIASAF